MQRRYLHAPPDAPLREGEHSYTHMWRIIWCMLWCIKRLICLAKGATDEFAFEEESVGEMLKLRVRRNFDHVLHIRLEYI